MRKFLLAISLPNNHLCVCYHHITAHDSCYQKFKVPTTLAYSVLPHSRSSTCISDPSTLPLAMAHQGRTERRGHATLRYLNLLLVK